MRRNPTRPTPTSRCHSVATSAHTADVIVSFETLEQLALDLQFMREVHRALRPDGRFRYSTPNRLVSHPGASASVRPMSRFHVREYPYTEFEHMLRQWFGRVTLFCQNPQRAWRTRLFAGLSRVFPPLLRGASQPSDKIASDCCISIARMQSRNPWRVGMALTMSRILAICEAPTTKPQFYNIPLIAAQRYQTVRFCQPSVCRHDEKT